MANSVDQVYQNLLSLVYREGDLIETRNGLVRSHCSVPQMIFERTPLVTVRKTAWKMALREMEWFMSGDVHCPDELLPWWKDQLCADGSYRGGYSIQYRQSGSNKRFDQIKYLMDGLRSNPNSRRLVLTTWNPIDMVNITELNNNEACPTCCHSTIIQLFVRNNRLNMTSYQRSADLLLGLPHNLIQSWALLLFFAHHSNLEVGHLRWIFGDAHCYCHETHSNTVEAILKCSTRNLDKSPTLCYNTHVKTTGVPVFKASDFTMDGSIPEPMVFSKPKLL